MFRLPDNALFAALLALMLTGCQFHAGHVVGARADTRFAHDDSVRLLLSMGRGTEIRTLSGEPVRTILAGNNITPYDIDDSGLRMVGSDHGYFALIAGEPVRRLDNPPFSYHLALNRSGTRIAAVDDHTITILSFDTLKVLRTAARPEFAWRGWISWDLENPDVVWLFGAGHDSYVRFDLAIGEVSYVPLDSNPPIRFSGERSLWQRTCPATGAELTERNDAIYVVEKGRRPRKLVAVKGYRVPLTSSHSSPFWYMGFVKGCRYAVYWFHGAPYLVDVATGDTGPLPGKPIYALER